MNDVRYQRSGVNRQFAICNWQFPMPARSSVYRPPSSCNRRSAFTMLEVMLVLAVIAAISALVWPSLQRPFATQRLRRAAEQVRMHLIKTRTRAITTGETFSFTCQRDKPLYRIECRTNNEAALQTVTVASSGGSQSGGTLAAYAAPSNNHSAIIPPVDEMLPDGINFAGDDVSLDARSGQIAAQDLVSGSVDISWSQPILFYPDGTASSARVALVGDRGRAIVVEIRGVTGGAKIGDIISVEDLRP